MFVKQHSGDSLKPRTGSVPGGFTLLKRREEEDEDAEEEEGKQTS